LIDEFGGGALQQQVQRLGHHLQVREFLGGNVEQHAAPGPVGFVSALGEVPHRGGEFTVGAAELFQQHLGEHRVRVVDAEPPSGC